MLTKPSTCSLLGPLREFAYAADNGNRNIKPDCLSVNLHMPLIMEIEIF